MCWEAYAASASEGRAGGPSPGPPERSRQSCHGAQFLGQSVAEQGDVPHAINQQRHALALREALPAPDARAISHSNLAIFLERSGTPSDLAESPRHQLAALVYHLVAGLGQELISTLSLRRWV
jgi:hypothetical protein